jgi:glycosyltransferase involved in cell wall biosynthesis
MLDQPLAANEKMIMNMPSTHICVCICTYKRPQLLDGLLNKLQAQKTGQVFSYSIVVADNDHEESAKNIVVARRHTSIVSIEYAVEPRKHIALARNKAIQNAKGDFLAFIDDDEMPVDDWLYNLHRACLQYNADGVLGPVKPIFETQPPQWVVRAQLFERPSYKTGTLLPWRHTRTGNVLFRKGILGEQGDWFSPEFRHSEDQDFFRRKMARGHTFIWCDEAPVHEMQTPDRFRLMYFIRRALLRGNVSLRLQSNKPYLILKSVTALSLYTLSLPFLLIVGRHMFIKYLIKECDHIGKLMAACNIDVQRYLA